MGSIHVSYFDFSLGLLESPSDTICDTIELACSRRVTWQRLLLKPRVIHLRHLTVIVADED